MNSKKKKIILASIAAVVVVAIVITITAILVNRATKKDVQSAKNIHTEKPSTKELDTMHKVNSYNIPKSYLITFKLSSKGTPTKLESIKQYKKLPDSAAPLGEYTLDLKGKDGISYSTNFSVSSIVSEAPQGDESSQQAPASTTPSSYSLFIPWVPEKSEYTVKTSDGKTILKGTIKNVQVIEK